MYKKTKNKTTSLTVNTSYVGETIEEKIQRIVNNKEPITDGAPLVYTERKDGVQAQYDIRTDRFELAIEAMDKVSSTHRAKREERIKQQNEKSMGEKAKDGMQKEGEGGAQPTGGTDTK